MAAADGEKRAMATDDKPGGSGGKRKMKTQYQLEVLERVYAEDKYPTEKVRSELIQQLNLSDRQLQMWFCHRRLKDRKVDESPASAAASSGTASGGPKKKKAKRNAGAAAPLVSSGAAESAAPALAAGPSSSNENGQQFSEEVETYDSAPKRAPAMVLTPELAAIKLVEEQLNEPLREDGPILGYEFDPLPPGAFDTPIEPAGQRTVMLDKSEFVTAPKRSAVGAPAETTSRVPHQFIPEHPTGTQFYERSTVAKGKTKDLEPEPSLSLTFLPPAAAATSSQEEREKVHEKAEPSGSSKKRKSDDAKLAKELEAQEKRQRKEAEKQEALRRKKEEQEKKEQEKINRERKKEQDKIMREREKEEERQKREQKKENERLQKLAQKEQQRVEKLRVKEETRRVKEAAKLKAAYERATAKKLAKLSTGLMDDEQLELMQMGAFVQGLVAGDMDGGAGFDRSKVELKKFPPASVHMKKVFGIPPWNSDQNVSNFFMVWRFLTTFSDGLGLWPFTVDEFAQGLHDFDSRLLNEIYVALLKTLIKDVEDAAQAAATGVAGSQHAISVAAGGHPQIVEAAYTWGFDIQEWGHHLNPLSWPEVLRQFALAAGYGPKWKKRSSETKADFAEICDGQNANAIATLRSGAAAANAVALMRGKNATRVKLKKSQHPRLTPGTVKYAAFHVLSVQGSRGLTILELADRIQKSGLRDLSSSKTPEASISAALSRDTNLFERVAPSTYAVRSPYRRDPDEAEDVLQAALERTYLYQTRRQLDPEKDDDEDEGESESEGEEHEVEEQHEHEHHETVPGKVILRVKQGKGIQIEKEPPVASTSAAGTAVGPSSSSSLPAAISQAEAAEAAKPEVLAARPENSESKLAATRCSPELEKKRAENEEEMEIDESQVGEPWVQGLMEGEFADLSIEERLNSLVALVDVLNEGNTIRSVLEDRYESASALKRQLWEEVQVDKRRLKEELTKSGAKPEAQEEEKHAASASMDYIDIASTSGSVSDKSRVQMKAEIRYRAERLYVIRSMPLGLDRRYNRYWQFSASNGGEDPGRARIYFESNEGGHWEVIDTEEALNSLMVSFDTRGVREASLYNILNRLGGPLRKAMRTLSQNRAAAESSKSEGSPSSGVFGLLSDVPEVPSAISVELGKNPGEVQRAMERYRELDRWLWSQCLKRNGKSFKVFSVGKKRDVETFASCKACHGLYWPTEKHCSLCHALVDPAIYAEHARECEEKFQSDLVPAEVLPSRIQLLKYLLLEVEVAVPTEALKPFWTTSSRQVWCDKVRTAASASELLQVFTELESAVNEDWISSSYETTEKALGTSSGAKNLPWVPQTTGATALRLKAFDAAIAYNPEQREQMEQEEEEEAENALTLGTTTGALHQAMHHEEATSSPDSDHPPNFQNGHIRGGKPRRRGGHSGGGSKAPKQQQQGRGARGGARGRGRSGAGGSRNQQQRQLQQREQQRLEQQEQHHQEQYHQPEAKDEDESSDGGWELGPDSDESEHSYDHHQEQEQQQEHHQEEEHHQQGYLQAEDEEYHHHQQEGYQEHGYEVQQQQGESEEVEYEEEEEEEEGYVQQEQEQHEGYEQQDEEEEVEEEEIEEEEVEEEVSEGEEFA